MSKHQDNGRLQEGALSALNTPKSPPPETKLVPLTPSRPASNGSKKQ